MDPTPFLDVTYLLNSSVVASIKSADSVVVLGMGPPLELSLTLFQVLMAFAEKKTAREAFQLLDVDVDLDHFGAIVQEFHSHGLLRLDQAVDDGPDLRSYLARQGLDDSVLLDKLSRAMRGGHAIVIPDALPIDLAERVHDELDRSNRWSLAEGGHDFFHYRNSFIDKLDAVDGALAECSRLFKSSATRRFISELSGQDCTGGAHAAAAWYRPGEYALPHDDSIANASRSVAYIWYLTKDWRREWGGALFWCPTGQYVCPGFNVLVMFNVTHLNMHLVCPVAPTATAKRLTVNGFWHQAEQSRAPVSVSSDAWISPGVIRQATREHLDVFPIIVL